MAIINRESGVTANYIDGYKTRTEKVVDCETGYLLVDGLRIGTVKKVQAIETRGFQKLSSMHDHDEKWSVEWIPSSATYEVSASELVIDVDDDSVLKVGQIDIEVDEGILIGCAFDMLDSSGGVHGGALWFDKKEKNDG